MYDILSADENLIEKEREKLNLPKPIEFEKGRITPDIIDKLMALLLIPFDDSAIKTGYGNGYKTIGVPYDLQYNRLQIVFGRQHIKKEHRVVDIEDVPGIDNKSPMYYFKVYVNIHIGNYTFYTDSNNEPYSKFITYYQADGIGWAGATTKGTAEKSAVANGIKDALRNIGMLRYLYVELDEDTSKLDVNTDDAVIPTGETTTIELLNNPIISELGTIFLRGKAKDLKLEKIIDIIIYAKNPLNQKEHSVMIETLNNYKKNLITGQKLNVEYKQTLYQGREQYIIQKVILRTKEGK